MWPSVSTSGTHAHIHKTFSVPMFQKTFGFLWSCHALSCLFSFVALLLIVGFVMFSSCVAFDHPLGDQYGLSESLGGGQLPTFE